MDMNFPENHEETLQRGFRWVFLPADHDEITPYFAKIKIDFFNKKILAIVYDDVAGKVHDWLQDVYTDEAARHCKIRTLNHKGETLADFMIQGLKISKHFMNFDYATSKCLSHKLVFSFRNVKRGNLSSK